MKSHLKKIVFVSDAIWPYNKGGKEKRLFDISTRLAKKNYDVHIYTMKWWEGENSKIENGVTLHAICPKYPLYSGDKRSIKQGIMFGLACFNLFKTDWDVIDVDHMPFFPLFSTKLVCLVKGKRMIATWNEVWGLKYWIKYMGLLGIVSYLIEQMSVFLPDKIIAISDHTKERISKMLFRSFNVVTVPIGIDIDHIKSVKPSATKSDVIYVGRLLSHKNVDVLIEAIELVKKTHPNIQCIIVGDGPEKERLGSLINKHNLIDNIKMLGFVEDEDEVFALMKSSKVFVLPSTREGFGIVVSEAAACGIPSIVIDHPENAAASALLNTSGHKLISKLDSKSVAEKVLRIIKESILLQANLTSIENSTIILEENYI